MRRLLVTAVAAALLLTACGDDGDVPRDGSTPQDWLDVSGEGYRPTDQIRVVEIEGVRCVLYRSTYRDGGRSLDCDWEHAGE